MRTLGDDRNGFGSSQRLGSIGRGNLADGVTEHNSGPDTVGAEAVRKRSLHGKQQRLCNRRISQTNPEIVRDDEVRQLFTEVVFEQSAKRLEILAEMRICAVGFHTHPGPLRTISGKHEGYFAKQGRSFATFPIGSIAGKMRLDRIENAALTSSIDCKPIF
ncbi:hypothetical protein D3C73_1133690 [compost metagenome]